MKVYPGKFSIHKKIGALQMSPIPATWTEQEVKGEVHSKVTKEGAIMIEMAPFKEEKNDNYYYDWADGKKVSFALGIPDISMLAEKAGTKFSLVHKTENYTKTMEFSPGVEKYEGTTMLSLYQKNKDGTTVSARVGFSAGEFDTFCNLLRTMVPSLLGWA